MSSARQLRSSSGVTRRPAHTAGRAACCLPRIGLGAENHRFLAPAPVAVPAHGTVGQSSDPLLRSGAHSRARLSCSAARPKSIIRSCGQGQVMSGHVIALAAPRREPRAGPCPPRPRRSCLGGCRGAPRPWRALRAWRLGQRRQLACANAPSSRQRTASAAKCATSAAARRPLRPGADVGTEQHSGFSRRAAAPCFATYLSRVSPNRGTTAHMNGRQSGSENAEGGAETQGRHARTPQHAPMMFTRYVSLAGHGLLKKQSTKRSRRRQSAKRCRNCFSVMRSASWPGPRCSCVAGHRASGAAGLRPARQRRHLNLGAQHVARLALFDLEHGRVLAAADAVLCGGEMCGAGGGTVRRRACIS
jgi:hypothetical protein